mmetsp:Transcript_6705/g.11417  ORF Transcript_6705/g.11417 Transcript_6705/m.11417 type:complete len:117 (+) Transcript_6705:284-634(+)
MKEVHNFDCVPLCQFKMIQNLNDGVPRQTVLDGFAAPVYCPSKLQTVLSCRAVLSIHTINHRAAVFEVCSPLPIHPVTQQLIRWHGQQMFPTWFTMCTSCDELISPTCQLHHCSLA